MNDSTAHEITSAIIPLVKGMCLKPNGLNHREDTRPGNFVLILSPDMADFRILCGKSGRQINALRWIISRAGKNMGIRTDVKLEESYRGKTCNGDPFRFNPNFERDSNFEEIFKNILVLVFDQVPLIRTAPDGDKLKIYLDIDTLNPDDMSTVTALADIFYPFGFRNGCKIEIRPALVQNSETTRNEKHDSRTNR